jgi:hypothetical protein
MSLTLGEPAIYAFLCISSAVKAAIPKQSEAMPQVPSRFNPFYFDWEGSQLWLLCVRVRVRLPFVFFSFLPP